MVTEHRRTLGPKGQPGGDLSQYSLWLACFVFHILVRLRAAKVRISGTPKKKKNHVNKSLLSLAKA